MTCQVWIRETNESEPLMTCRKFEVMSKPGGYLIPGQAQRPPVYWLGGIRHGGGVNLVRALLRNVGTCRSDGKGEIQVEDPRG